jgi:hypothetical protein
MGGNKMSCELFATVLQPLECRYCHRERPGLGLKCHSVLEKDWRTPVGQALVARWSQFEKMEAYLITGGLVYDNRNLMENK